ncbi:hypothetical protein SKAU_G00124880 [Synaphobranchus kaupii]|uniref:Uncharacterized protein n=1 Tax=Synaphobranchus kaupii TaxID=118154 RepID=A0A9Q1FQ76_SYNKA|nr:hypothetical protein SKAU_G00124880 [Synaphobranchus kaupii]
MTVNTSCITQQGHQDTKSREALLVNAALHCGILSKHELAPENPTWWKLLPVLRLPAAANTSPSTRELRAICRGFGLPCPVTHVGLLFRLCPSDKGLSGPH